MKKCNGSIYQQELIGSHIEVINAEHSGYLGLKGIILDETKNTFNILDSTKETEKIVPKKGIKFKLRIDDHTSLLNGDKLNFRPEERIKRAG